MAAIDVTAQVAHRGLELSTTSPVAPLYDDLISESEGADTGLAAMRSVLAWAASCADQWLGLISRSQCADQRLARPMGGGQPGGLDMMAVYPHRLREYLERGGYSYAADACGPGATGAGWRWIPTRAPDSQGAHRWRPSLDGCIRREAADA